MLKTKKHQKAFMESVAEGKALVATRNAILEDMLSIREEWDGLGTDLEVFYNKMVNKLKPILGEEGTTHYLIDKLDNLTKFMEAVENEVQRLLINYLLVKHFKAKEVASTVDGIMKGE